MFEDRHDGSTKGLAPPSYIKQAFLGWGLINGTNGLKSLRGIFCTATLLHCFSTLTIHVHVRVNILKNLHWKS